MSYNRLEALEFVTAKRSPGKEYAKANEKTNDMLRHWEGKHWSTLLMEKRPTEPQEVYDWRVRNFRKPTKAYLSKVIQILQGIPRAADFIAHFPDSAPILGDDTFQRYCETQWPYYDSVWSWVREELVKALIIEPNGVLVVQYEKMGEEETEFDKPTFKIYPTETALIVEENLVLIKTDDFYYFPTGKSTAIFLLIDDKSYSYYAANEDVSSFIEISSTPHNLGECPAFRLGGNTISVGECDIYESFCAGIVPMFDQVLTDFSDWQGAMKQHVYPERWQWGETICSSCKGEKQIAYFDDKENKQKSRVCHSCKGVGYVASPFSTIMVRNSKAGENPAPIPPAGYIEKDLASTKMLEEAIDKNLYRGLAAINMEFLAQSPAAQSGVAKEYDRQDLNNFIYAVAEHLIKGILEPALRYAARLRYGALLKNKDTAAAQAPTIHVPQKFDVVSTGAMIEKRKALKEAGANPSILQMIDLKIALRELAGSPLELAIITNTIELNPLGGFSVDELMALRTDGAASAEDVYLAININRLVRQAITKNPKFIELSYDDRLAAVKALMPALPTPAQMPTLIGN